MKVSRVFFILTVLVAMALSAQGQMEAPKPAPELKKLDYFVGTWTVEGDMKKGPMGPGGKMTETEMVEWMDGGFFLVMHDNFKSENMGNGTGVAYMGYDTYNSLYTYDSFESTGEAEHAHGDFKNDTWTWNSEQMMGSKHMKTRFTVKTLTPTSYTFKFEMSYDGDNWLLIMDGKANKQK